MEMVAEEARLVQVTGVRGQEALSKLDRELELAGGWRRSPGLSPVEKLVCLRGVEAAMQTEAKIKQAAPVAALPKPQPATKPVATVAAAPKTELHGLARAAAAFSKQFPK